eukprot:6176723-Pleurochrysis_carterae.AAC.5
MQNWTQVEPRCIYDIIKQYALWSEEPRRVRPSKSPYYHADSLHGRKHLFTTWFHTCGKRACQIAKTCWPRAVPCPLLHKSGFERRGDKEGRWVHGIQWGTGGNHRRRLLLRGPRAPERALLEAPT